MMNLESVKENFLIYFFSHWVCPEQKNSIGIEQFHRSIVERPENKNCTVKYKGFIIFPKVIFSVQILQSSG